MAIVDLVEIVNETPLLVIEREGGVVVSSRFGTVGEMLQLAEAGLCLPLNRDVPPNPKSGTGCHAQG